MLALKSDCSPVPVVNSHLPPVLRHIIAVNLQGLDKSPLCVFAWSLLTETSNRVKSSSMSHLHQIKRQTWCCSALLTSELLQLAFLLLLVNDIQTQVHKNEMFQIQLGNALADLQVDTIQELLQRFRLGPFASSARLSLSGCSFLFQDNIHINELEVSYFVVQHACPYAHRGFTDDIDYVSFLEQWKKAHHCLHILFVTGSFSCVDQSQNRILTSQCKGTFEKYLELPPSFYKHPVKIITENGVSPYLHISEKAKWA